MTRRTYQVIGLVFVLLAALAVSMPAATLNFRSFNSFPSEQGWTYGSECSPAFPEGINLPEEDAFSVANGLLRLDTAARGTSFVDGFYQLSDVIDETAGWTFEVRLRVLAVDPPPPTCTIVFVLGVQVNGYFYELYIADGEVGTFDPPAPHYSVDTRSFHTYSMVKQAGSTTYTVLVDGVPVLTESSHSTVLTDNVLSFGDGTCQCRNGIVEISSVRFVQGCQ